MFSYSAGICSPTSRLMTQSYLCSKYCGTVRSSNFTRPSELGNMGLRVNMMCQASSLPESVIFLTCCPFNALRAVVTSPGDIFPGLIQTCTIPTKPTAQIEDTRPCKISAQLMKLELLGVYVRWRKHNIINLTMSSSSDEIESKARKQLSLDFPYLTGH